MFSNPRIKLLLLIIFCFGGLLLASGCDMGTYNKRLNEVESVSPKADAESDSDDSDDESDE